MAELTIKTRMYVNLAILAAALLVVGGLGLTTLNRTAERMEALYRDNLVPIQQIDEVYQRSLQSQQYRLEAYVHRDLAFTQANYEAVKANRARINELMELVEQVELAPNEKALSDEILRQRAALVSIGKQEIEALLAGDYETATQIRLNQIEPIIDAMDRSTEQLTESRRERAQALITAVQAEIVRERWAIVGGFLASLTLAFAFAMRLTRQVTTRLESAAASASAVSVGQLGKSRPSESGDEIGKVIGALHEMDSKLLLVAQGIARSAGEVDRAARQFSEGSDELSERTQQQAAALEETAASMEQITSTIKQTADNTALANEIVANAKKRADEGGTVLSRTVQAMDAIRASSHRIEDIIGVIDEIAFQTNLLALNAAVEAARAGEQGRGFAVVAGEVRNLAQRSASAAKEIKGLISDSVEKVSAGSRLVSDSGQKLSEIVLDVKRVADLVQEMSAASKEQSTGIDQISRAVTDMDSTTQQNAALVEESSAAAKVLQQQAQELYSLVSFFSFEGSPAQVREPHPSSMRSSVTPLHKPAKIRSRPVLARASGDGLSWKEF